MTGPGSPRDGLNLILFFCVVTVHTVLIGRSNMYGTMFFIIGVWLYLDMCGHILIPGLNNGLEPNTAGEGITITWAFALQQKLSS